MNHSLWLIDPERSGLISSIMSEFFKTWFGIEHNVEGVALRYTYIFMIHIMVIRGIYDSFMMHIIFIMCIIWHHKVHIILIMWIILSQKMHIIKIMCTFWFCFDFSGLSLISWHQDIFQRRFLWKDFIKSYWGFIHLGDPSTVYEYDSKNFTSLHISLHISLQSDCNQFW